MDPDPPPTPMPCVKNVPEPQLVGSQIVVPFEAGNETLPRTRSFPFGTGLSEIDTLIGESAGACEYPITTPLAPLLQVPKTLVQVAVPLKYSAMGELCAVRGRKLRSVMARTKIRRATILPPRWRRSRRPTGHLRQAPRSGPKSHFLGTAAHSFQCERIALLPWASALVSPSEQLSCHG